MFLNCFALSPGVRKTLKMRDKKIQDWKRNLREIQNYRIVMLFSRHVAEQAECKKIQNNMPPYDSTMTASYAYVGLYVLTQLCPNSDGRKKTKLRNPGKILMSDNDCRPIVA